MTSEVLGVVKMLMLVFWVVPTCGRRLLTTETQIQSVHVGYVLDKVTLG
jgi:hypothetical protein